MRSAQTTTLLGLPIDRISTIELRAWLRRAFASARAHRIVTLNPEIAFAAWRDPRYAAVIRTADLITADGVGVTLALRLLRSRMMDRLTGSRLLEEACAIAEEDEKTATFLIRNDGLTAPPLLHARLRDRWPRLKTAIATIDPDAPLELALRQAIADQQPALLIVNFGHPTQENWIAQHIDQFPTVRIAFGVGGAVDYFSGAVPWPPLLIRRAGLEWCWRLLRQPHRWRRILTATIRFPFAVIRSQLLSSSQR